MRNVFILLLAAATFQACTEKKEAYQINLNLEESEGKWAKLLSRVDREYVTADSALLVAGEQTTLSGSVEGVKTMYLTVEGVESSIQLLMENSTYTISGSVEDPEITTGSKAHNDLMDYQEMLQTHQ
jgi:hypothetical protein